MEESDYKDTPPVVATQPCQPGALLALAGTKSTHVGIPTGASAIECPSVRLGPFPAGEFAPDLPPNSPETRENPASRTEPRRAIPASCFSGRILETPARLLGKNSTYSETTDTETRPRADGSAHHIMEEQARAEGQPQGRHYARMVTRTRRDQSKAAVASHPRPLDPHTC